MICTLDSIARTLILIVSTTVRLVEDQTSSQVKHWESQVHSNIDCSHGQLNIILRATLSNQNILILLDKNISAVITSLGLRAMSIQVSELPLFVV